MKWGRAAHSAERLRPARSTVPSGRTMAAVRVSAAQPAVQLGAGSGGDEDAAAPLDLGALVADGLRSW